MHSTKARKQQNTASGNSLPRSLFHHDWVFSLQVFNVTPPELFSDLILAGLSISRVSSLHYLSHCIFVLVWFGFCFWYKCLRLLFLKKTGEYLKMAKGLFGSLPGWRNRWETTNCPMIHKTWDLLLEQSSLGRVACQLEQQSFAENWQKLVERSQNLWWF